MLTATDPRAPITLVPPAAVDMSGVVQRVIWNLKSGQKCLERRRGQRHAFPYPLHIWPAAPEAHEAELPCGDGTVVLGKHLSSGGIDFYSQSAIAERRIIVRLEEDRTSAVHVLVELTWCRFGGHGTYLNGGRFVRVLAPAAHHPKSRVG